MERPQEKEIKTGGYFISELAQEAEQAKGYNKCKEEYDSYHNHVMEPVRKMFQEYQDGRSRVSYKFIDEAWNAIQEAVRRNNDSNN